MFRKAKVVSISFLFLFALLFYYKTFYAPLMDMTVTTPLGIKKISPEEPFQYRTKVSKDLFFTSKGERQHYHLESPTSTLSMQFIANEPLEITETFDDMSLWMGGVDQRMIKADLATCYYFQKILKANDVFFSSHSVMDGKVKAVSLSFKERPPHLEAVSLQAHFNHKEIK